MFQLAGKHRLLQASTVAASSWVSRLSRPVSRSAPPHLLAALQVVPWALASRGSWANRVCPSTPASCAFAVDWCPLQKEAFPPLWGAAQVYRYECKCFFSSSLTTWSLSKIRMARSVLGPATSIANDFRPDPRRVVLFLLFFQTMSRFHFTPSSRIRARARNWQVSSTVCQWAS